MNEIGKELGEITRRAFVPGILKKIRERNVLFEHLYAGWLERHPPLTRWQRLKRRMYILRDRCRLAWRVLRGDDIFEDYDE